MGLVKMLGRGHDFTNSGQKSGIDQAKMGERRSEWKITGLIGSLSEAGGLSAGEILSLLLSWLQHHPLQGECGRGCHPCVLSLSQSSSLIDETPQEVTC